jgi:hypothetical protein
LVIVKHLLLQIKEAAHMNTMDLLQLAKVCRSEEEAFHFLFQKRRGHYGVSCPGCNSSEYYLMHPGRLRCKECKRDYHPFSGETDETEE